MTVWANDAPQRHRLQVLFGTDAARVHFAPVSRSEEIASCVLYEYRFDPGGFEPWIEAEGQWISLRTVTPVDVAPVGDLIARHREANVDLRFVRDLRAVRSKVLDSRLPFSIVRYRE